MGSRETTLESCALCGASDFVMLYKRIKEHSNIVTCKSCQVTFSNPQIEMNYADHKKYVVNYLKNENGRRKTAQWRLDQIKKFKSEGKIFEVGCSGGLFLDEARKSGFDPSGAELNKDAVTYGREHLGLTVHEEIDLKNIDFQNKCDVVALFNVLEHVPRPTEFINTIKDHVLAEHGVIVIEVPNIFTVHSKLFGTKGQHLSIAHLFYFSEKSLENYLESMGLTIVDKQWGKRIYPVGLSFEIVLRRHKFLKHIVSRVLKTFRLFDKDTSLNTKDFLFYIVGRKTAA